MPSRIVNYRKSLNLRNMAVGGRGKGVAIIEPDQKTYKDYGLLDARNYPSALLDDMPNMLPKASSVEEAFRRASKPLLGGKDYHLIKTPVESVIVNKSQLNHIVEKRADARERYANLILSTLVEPNEVWLTGYDDGFRRRFIKLFKSEKNMLVVVRENTDGSLFWNAIPTRSSYVDKQRMGVLLYKRQKQRAD